MRPVRSVQRAVPAVAGRAAAVFFALRGASNGPVAFLPRLAGALVILLGGWLVAGAVGALVSGGLRAVRFDGVADRAGPDRFLDRAGDVRAPAPEGTTTVCPAAPAGPPPRES